MRIRFLIVLGLLFLSCGTTKKVHFETDTFVSKGITEHFEIVIPRRYIKTYSNLETHLFKNWIYEGNGFLYVSLDISFANSPNIKNWIKCSNVITKTKCTEGINQVGNYWKELVIENLVVGYKDISKERKDEFDKALSSLVKKLELVKP